MRRNNVEMKSDMKKWREYQNVSSQNCREPSPTELDIFWVSTNEQTSVQTGTLVRK